ncbi:unnamed protein product [Brassica napus]|uniref:(rape) hypothetical protein n=1 Tax=Brassica napus TaxID=3708 RepID=A0A817B3W1_BRANA|nr:unnamed protein product [Brassica napus]
MSLRFLLHNGALIPILLSASAGSFAEVLGGEMGPVRRDIVIPKRCTRKQIFLSEHFVMGLLNKMGGSSHNPSSCPSPRPR